MKQAGQYQGCFLHGRKIRAQAEVTEKLQQRITEAGERWPKSLILRTFSLAPRLQTGLRMIEFSASRASVWGSALWPLVIASSGNRSIVAASCLWAPPIAGHPTESAVTAATMVKASTHSRMWLSAVGVHGGTSPAWRLLAARQIWTSCSRISCISVISRTRSAAVPADSVGEETSLSSY